MKTVETMAKALAYTEVLTCPDDKNHFTSPNGHRGVCPFCGDRLVAAVGRPVYLLFRVMLWRIPLWKRYKFATWALKGEDYLAVAKEFLIKRESGASPLDFLINSVLGEFAEEEKGEQDA